MKKKSAQLPIVDAYLAGDYAAIKQIVKETPPGAGLHLYHRAIGLCIHKNQDEAASPVEAYRAMRQALVLPPADPELFAILLRYAVDLALRLTKPAEAQQCLRLLKQIDDPALRQELKCVLPMLAESRIAYYMGDYAKAFASTDAALRGGLPVGGALWYQVKSQRVLYGCLIGQFTQAERDVEEMAEYPHLEHAIRPPLAYVRALVCRTRGRFSEALALLDGMTEEQKSKVHHIFLRLRIHLLLMLGRTAEGERLLDLDQQAGKRTLSPGEFENLRAISALTQGLLDDARRHARQAIACTSGVNLIDLRWSMGLLVEAELAAGNARVARSILRMMDQQGSLVTERMPWIRLYLLEGATDQALAAFHLLVENAEPEVIQEGLRFAYELKPVDVARLWTRTGFGPSRAAVPAAPVLEDDLLVGTSPALRQVKDQIAKFAESDATVLITGETGTGKELVARMLHRQSRRASQPFLPVNCGALSDTLIESELFGYAKGAFTGAMHHHVGLFVAAGEGVLFLDEIEAMSPHMQVALLRVLEERAVRPVGSTKPQRVQARIIVASNQPLEAQAFRQDLYFRLAQLHLHLPPLRERTEDIPLLVRHFLRGMDGAQDVTVANDLLEALQRQPWPGNIRELRNALERILLLAGGEKTWHAELFASNVERTPTAAVKAPPSPSAPRLSEVAARPQALADRPRSGRYAAQRLEQLRRLFREHHKLTRAEVVRLLGCAIETANRDLEALEREGAILRVCLPASHRTSHFVCAANPSHPVRNLRLAEREASEVQNGPEE